MKNKPINGVNMDIKDAHGKIIKIGSFIRYPSTGTVGKVLDIEIEDNRYWVKLDKTDLWYDSQFIEIISQSDFENTSPKKIQSNKKETVDDIKDDLKEDMEDITLVSGGAEGGG